MEKTEAPLSVRAIVPWMESFDDPLAYPLNSCDLPYYRTLEKAKTFHDEDAAG